MAAEEKEVGGRVKPGSGLKLIRKRSRIVLTFQDINPGEMKSKYHSIFHLARSGYITKGLMRSCQICCNVDTSLCMQKIKCSFGTNSFFVFDWYKFG